MRAQRSPAGSRLVATYPLGDLTITAETLLWDGADRVEFRTRLSGAIGKDRMLRVRFPAAAAGGLPVYQTATAVIGRPFGTPEADTAAHSWTLDNPANQWFGVGSVARVVLATTGGEVPVALGVAEVVTPDVIGSGDRRLVRDLLVSLARAGVTATCSRATGPRYGSVDVDSNLPDFRIALGGPAENAFTAEVLAAAEPPVAKQLAALVADGTGARLWVPAAQSRASAFAPDADLRGPRDLPVLIVAPRKRPAWSRRLASGLASWRADWPARSCTPRWPTAPGALPGEPPLAGGTVALFNRGTPSGGGHAGRDALDDAAAAPAPAGRAGCGSTATGGPRLTGRASPGSTGRIRSRTRWRRRADGWREAGFNAGAEDYNHDLTAVVTGEAAEGGDGGGDGDGAAALTLSVRRTSRCPPSSRIGNPLAAGLPGEPPADRAVTVRLRETEGMSSLVRVRAGAALGGIEAAWRASLLEEEDDSGLPVSDGAALVGIGPFETVTAVLRLGAAPDSAPAAAPVEPPVPPEPAAAGAHAVLAARQGPGARRERPGRGARHTDQDHARRLQRWRRSSARATPPSPSSSAWPAAPNPPAGRSSCWCPTACWRRSTARRSPRTRRCPSTFPGMGSRRGM